MRRLALTAVQEDLVAEYAADLHAVGLGSSARELLWGARVFCTRFADPSDWIRVPLAERLSHNIKFHRFVAWLAATGRLRLDPDYLMARRSRLGPVLARHWPVFHAHFVETARTIGFGEATIWRQWAALGRTCALTGIAPDQLTHRLLDGARDELLGAARRVGNGGKETATAMFGLEATLFHAGVVDELPRRRTPTKVSVRVAQWASLPATLASTMRRYLDQIAISLRPGTVQNSEATLLEFSSFVVERDPSVRCVADLGRRHVEAYKAWLAERPAARGGPLHRHTIRDRLGNLRCFFNRLVS